MLLAPLALGHPEAAAPVRLGVLVPAAYSKISRWRMLQAAHTFQVDGTALRRRSAWASGSRCARHHA